MQKDIRNYTVGVEVVRVSNQGVVTVRPYTNIDGDLIYGREMELIVGDSYQVSYSKSVEFIDTIDAGDRKWEVSRTIPYK